MEETPIFKGPLPGEGDPPDGAAQVSAAVEWVEGLLAEIEELILHPGAPGQIIIVNGTSDPVYKSVTGDVGLTTGGVTSIGAGKVLEAMLGGESVATAKIKALAVTAAKVAENAVTTAKIEGLAVTEAKIAALAVSAAKLANEAVETGKIKNLAVTEAKLAAGAVSAVKLAAGAIPAGRAHATGKLVVGNAYADIPGASKVLNPARASLLTVIMTFDYYSVLATDFFGALNLGGAVQGPIAFKTHANGGANERFCVTQTVVAEVAAGEVTAKLQAKKNGPEAVVAELEPENTGFAFFLTPN